MERINLPEELRKRGFKLTPLPPLTSEQREHIQKINKDVNDFLKKMEKAHKVSQKSTLRFTTYSGHCSFTQIRQKNKE